MLLLISFFYFYFYFIVFFFFFFFFLGGGGFASHYDNAVSNKNHRNSAEVDRNPRPYINSLELDYVNKFKFINFQAYFVQ